MHVAEYVADMLALEAQVQALLAGPADDVAGSSRAEAARQRFHSLVDEHRAALGHRLSALGGTEVSEPIRLARLAIRPGTTDTAAHPNPASRALHSWYAAFNHLTLGYSILHAVAHRFYDSKEDGNTADLAEEHLRRYASAAQEINQLISDVVVWELGSAGEECRCQCPGCGLGICLCASHGTNTLNQAWRETTPAPAGPGIEVRPPRTGSPAIPAGLEAGDRVVAVDDRELATDLDAMTLQKAIGAHGPGESIRLDVLRGSDRRHVNVTRP